ncbi:conserved hypothetical protein [Rubrivivax sp. A210]|uniref:DUF5666 domain-containing protein n=1 Tax=Rubrivivax sp. A210 TaxID=2772301 RepID=UPI001918E855|nr:DUF5666 domain-containing protein [Rubrivivax sp. A210]CAD5372364.1 conserved hypothetical protein [Rubrivivax sp. A210]
MNSSKSGILLSPLQGLSRGWRLLLLAVATSAAVLGCGGGVGTGGTGSFSTSYSSGSITGLGSVTVNGVRYDDSQAVVEGEGLSGGRRDLRLGMTVDVDSGPVTTTATGAIATATRIRVDSELVGPVNAVDRAASSLTVLGQRVLVDVTTDFDDRLPAGRLDGLLVDSKVQVFAVFDPAQSAYRASRIEPVADTRAWHLRGPLAAVDAQSVRIGAVSYSYAGVAAPANLAVGQFVRLTLSGSGLPAGTYAVTGFGVALRVLADADDLKFKGLVSALDSLSSFSVNGRPVDARGATLVPAGGAGLVLGARVQIKGQVRGGTLRATEVSVVTEDEEHQAGLELHGSIDSVNRDTSSLVLRDTDDRLHIVGFGGPVRYRDNNRSAADLQRGARVEIKGLPSADGRRLEATDIRFE